MPNTVKILFLEDRLLPDPADLEQQILRLAALSVKQTRELAELEADPEPNADLVARARSKRDETTALQEALSDRLQRLRAFIAAQVDPPVQEQTYTILLPRNADQAAAQTAATSIDFASGQSLFSDVAYQGVLVARCVAELKEQDGADLNPALVARLWPAVQARMAVTDDEIFFTVELPPTSEIDTK